MRRRQQGRVSIEMEKRTVENKQNTSHYRHLWHSDKKCKNLSKNCSFRSNNTSYTLRSSWAWIESSWRTRFARHARSKISFVLRKCGAKFGQNERSRQTASWADTDTFADPTRFQCELNIRANIHKNVTEGQNMQFLYDFFALFSCWHSVEIHGRWDKGISAIYLANKNILM